MNRYSILFLICCLFSGGFTYAQTPKPSASIAREKSELSAQMLRRTDLVITLANLLNGTAFEPKDTARKVLGRAVAFKGFFQATPWTNEVNIAKICLEYNQVHEPLVALLKQLDKQPDIKKNEFVKDLLTQLSASEKRVKDMAANYSAVCKKFNRQDMLLPKGGLKYITVNL